MDDYRRANRALWNNWTALHAKSRHYDVEGFKAGTSTLTRLEIHEVGAVMRKSLLQLQCHFGLDTLSWARRRAEVTGVDFSERAIELACSLAEETGLPARFVCADIYDLPRVAVGAKGGPKVTVWYGQDYLPTTTETM